MSRWVVIALWLLAGVSLLAFLSAAPCNRTQEARVLVSAREMAEEGGERWVLPTCNGEPRVQKPPVAYWAAATLFRATGRVDELMGRLPSVLWAWLTVGVVYAAGARWVSRPAGLAAAGMLLTSFLFYRYGRLAETDIPATLGVTVSIAAFWRGMEMARGGGRAAGAAKWCALGGVAAGLAFLAKQGPGFYPLLFVVLFAVVRRNWRGLATAMWAGLIPAVVVAAPWYVYLLAMGYGKVLASEAAVTAGGSDHGGGVGKTIAQLFMASAPWVGLWPAAVVLALMRRRRKEAQALLCWAGATLLPLLFIGNRQIHYLMTGMPPLMLLSAWALAQADFHGARLKIRGYFVLAMRALMVCGVVGGIGTMVVGLAAAAGRVAMLPREMGLLTVALGGMLVGAGLAPAMIRARRSLVWATVRASAGLAVVFPWLVGAYAARLEPSGVHESALMIEHKAEGRRLVFVGEPSLSLVFQLGHTVLSVGKRVPETLASDGSVAVIVESDPEQPAAKMPWPWQLAWRGGPEGHHYQLWLANGAEGPSTLPAGGRREP